MRIDVGVDLAVGADRQTVVLEVDRTADFALDEQVLFAAYIAVDVNRRTDDCGITAARRTAAATRGARLRPGWARLGPRTRLGRSSFLTDLKHDESPRFRV